MGSTVVAVLRVCGECGRNLFVGTTWEFVECCHCGASQSAQTMKMAESLEIEGR